MIQEIRMNESRRELYEVIIFSTKVLLCFKVWTEVEEKITDFQNLGDVSDKFKKIKLDEISELEQKLQQSQQNGNQLIQLKRNELLRPLYKKVGDAITVIAQADGYTQILTTSGNEFAYADEKFDLTQKVMDKLGVKLPER